MRDFKDFDTMEKELGEKRGVISALDFAKEAVAIAIVAIDVAAVTRNKELADAIAAMKLDEAVSKLFPEEPQEEKNTEKDAKFEDLKNLLFTHATSYRVPIPVTAVAYSSTAETRRTAKYWALLALISNAGLAEEYNEWLEGNVHE